MKQLLSNPWVAKSAHFALGVLTAKLTTVNPLLAVIVFASFLAYELVEKWTIRDAGYPEIREYLLGLVAGEVIPWP